MGLPCTEKVYVVFFGMSRGFYLCPNPYRGMNFWKATNKNWSNFVICTKIPIARNSVDSRSIYRQYIGGMSIIYQRMSVVHWWYIGGLSVEYRWETNLIGRHMSYISTEYRPSINRASALRRPSIARGISRYGDRYSGRYIGRYSTEVGDSTYDPNSVGIRWVNEMIELGSQFF